MGSNILLGEDSRCQGVHGLNLDIPRDLRESVDLMETSRCHESRRSGSLSYFTGAFDGLEVSGEGPELYLRSGESFFT